MKNIFTSVFLILGFIGLQAYYKADPMSDVIDAIKKSNISKLATYFDQTVEVALPDKSGNYSKPQAEIIIKDFFNMHAIKSFMVEHKGNNSSSQYSIGHLITSNGSFRMTVFMKQKAGTAVVQEIRIENQR